MSVELLRNGIGESNLERGSFHLEFLFSEILDIEDWPFNYFDCLANVLLHLAARISDVELTRLLLSKGARVTSVDLKDQSALHIACSRKSLEIIKLLTEISPAYMLEETDDEDRRPLEIACSHNCPEAVQFLLTRGCSVHVQDFPEDFREGSLLCAIRNIPDYAVPIASMVLDAGADIHLTDDIGTTLLMFVVFRSAFDEINSGSEKYSYADLFTLFIERGCDVNATRLGSTVLHLAVIEKQEILVRKNACSFLELKSTGVMSMVLPHCSMHVEEVARDLWIYL
ncbi:transient receptor potential cation channel subfamily A member 1-like [Stegodyphus dumicola]|uniref:transient receptor potential cation channel subfamily A member 1-like n=1 Tax=Stegodyphus dumicola TaxID=202533 RepID=UPI0015B2B41C|nr:transient receptor potential cation channel subfamily A member 1-like [Stegodyphus dumicola]